MCPNMLVITMMIMFDPDDFQLMADVNISWLLMVNYGQPVLTIPSKNAIWIGRRIFQAHKHAPKKLVCDFQPFDWLVYWSIIISSVRN